MFPEKTNLMHPLDINVWRVKSIYYTYPVCYNSKHNNCKDLFCLTRATPIWNISSLQFAGLGQYSRTHRFGEIDFFFINLKMAYYSTYFHQKFIPQK